MKSNSILLFETIRDKLNYKPHHLEYWIKDYEPDPAWSLYIKIGKYNKKTGRIADWFVAPNVYYKGEWKIRNSVSLEQAIQQLKSDLEELKIYSQVK